MTAINVASCSSATRDLGIERQPVKKIAQDQNGLLQASVIPESSWARRSRPCTPHAPRSSRPLTRAYPLLALLLAEPHPGPGCRHLGRAGGLDINLTRRQPRSTNPTRVQSLRRIKAWRVTEREIPKVEPPARLPNGKSEEPQPPFSRGAGLDFQECREVGKPPMGKTHGTPIS